MPDLHFLSGHIMRGFMVLNTFFGAGRGEEIKKRLLQQKNTG